MRNVSIHCRASSRRSGPGVHTRTLPTFSVVSSRVSSRTCTCSRTVGRAIPKGRASSLIDVGPVETSCRMLRRVGSASAPNVWSSDTYLGTWLTIRNDVGPSQRTCEAVTAVCGLQPAAFGIQKVGRGRTVSRVPFSPIQAGLFEYGATSNDTQRHDAVGY